MTLEFKNIDVEFKPEVEIFRLMGTANPNHFQIIAKDIVNNLVIIMTWDIDKNMEINMYQIKPEAGCYPENYVVKGLNESYNYYMSNSHIVSMECNIPMQAVQENTLCQTGHFRKENNERKIFIVQTRYLS